LISYNDSRAEFRSSGEWWYRAAASERRLRLLRADACAAAIAMARVVRPDCFRRGYPPSLTRRSVRRLSGGSIALPNMHATSSGNRPSHEPLSSGSARSGLDASGRLAAGFQQHITGGVQRDPGFSAALLTTAKFV
jgi:hypothetical protein